MNRSGQYMSFSVLGGLLLMGASACSNQPAKTTLSEEEKCPFGEHYICVGGSSSKLETEQSKQGEFCSCRNLADMPQVDLNGSAPY